MKENLRNICNADLSDDIFLKTSIFALVSAVKIDRADIRRREAIC